MRSVSDSVQAVLAHVRKELRTFDVRTSRTIGWARSLVAIAQILTLALTPASYLFVPVGAGTAGPQCRASNAWTAYCVTGQMSPQITSWILVGVLCLVVSGYFPRLSALAHVWVSFSIYTAVSLPDGGDVAAQFATLFIALLLMSDDRRNHWHRCEAATSPPRLVGVSWAASWVLRAQISWIYLSASMGKVSVEDWQSGTAIYYVARQIFFGVDGPLAGLVLYLTGVPGVVIALTWGSIVLELAIALLCWGRYRARLVGFVLCAVFHVGIILVIGLWSFGLIMIGLVLANLASPPQRRHRPSATEAVSVPRQSGVGGIA